MIDTQIIGDLFFVFLAGAGAGFVLKHLAFFIRTSLTR